MADISATMATLSSTESTNAPAGGTAVGTGLDDNLRMLGALLAAFRDATGWGALALGTVAGTNTITAAVPVRGSVTMAPTAYATGNRYYFVPAATNTGATTLNIDSLGAKNVFAGGAACVGGEIVIGVPVVVEYDGTQFNILGFFHFNALTSEASVASGDFFPIYDISESGYNKASLANIFAAVTATQADQETSTSTTLAVTPGRQQFHPSAAKGWVHADFNGGQSGSYNLTSVTDNATGDMTINWNTDFSSTSYCPVATVLFEHGGTTATVFVAQFMNTGFAAGTTRIRSIRVSDGTEQDASNIMCVAYGDQ